MDQDTVETFFANVKWFNNFFADMRTLFDKISNVFEKNTDYTNKYLYYHKPDQTLSIPATYFLGMDGEGTLKLQIIAIFDIEFVKNKYFEIREPSIVVLQHDYDENNLHHIGWNILENKYIKEIEKANELISGILDWREGINFTAFVLPIDLFIKYEDKIVRDKIINKLR